MYIVSKKHDENGFEVGRLFKDFKSDNLIYNDILPCDGKSYPRKQFPELEKQFPGDFDYFTVPLISDDIYCEVYNMTMDDLWTKLMNYDPLYHYVERNFL